MAKDTRKHIFDEPKNLRRVILGLYVLCAISLALELVIHRHVDHPFEALPAFYSLFGFASIVGLVLLAKQLRKVVMRPEDYYDK